MLVTEGLGFKSLVHIVVCLAFPVIVFLIRRKWRRSVARKEEIERLLILAKEEADRAELEASASYSGLVSYSGPVSVSQTSFTCAVCYCPTTTRCARCKAVRYCSGRCQIIHWRQGHKEECRPPSISNHLDHDGSSGQSVVQSDSNNDRYKKEPCMKDDDNTVCSVADSEETSSVSGSSGNSFSGFSSSAAAGESSDDVSVSESTSSSELEGSDDQISLDIGRGTSDPNLDKVNQTNPVSPKFASLVESVHNFDRSVKFKEITQSSQVLENQGASSNSPARTRSVSEISSIGSTRKVSSGLLGGPFEAVVRDLKAPADSSLSKSTNARNNSSSDAEPVQSVMFNQSRQDVQSDEKKGIKIDTTDPDATGISNPFGRAASSEKSCADTRTIRSSMSSNIEKSEHTDPDMSSNSNVSEPGELKAASLSDVPCPSLRNGREILGPSVKVSGSSSTSFARSNLPDVSVSTSQPSDSRLSHSESPRRHSVSKINENSVPDVKEKVNTVKSSTQMESFTMASSVSGLKSSVKKVVDQFRGHKYGRYNDKGLFPYDSFVKLYTTTKVDMQPCGLINCRNSCYANAVLQCLLFTPPLTAYFVQGLHSKSCANKERCFLCEFEKLIVKAKEGKSPLSPIGIITQLKNIGCQLGHGREEDAHEFLRYAVDAMQSICFKEYGVTKPGFMEEETTLIGLTFGGYLRSKIRCAKCQNKSERQERMMDLTVEIEGDVEKLEDALKRFTSTEILDGENKYLCDRCKSYQKAKKKLTIHEAPNVLTIALKRFQSGKFGKLNKPIRFPEILDLAPYMSGTSDTSPIYRLYGVVVHLDVMNAAFSGHYVCYVKNLQNKWFKINDSEVSSVEVKKVLSEGAYMLLYARCSPRAPRCIRNHMSSDPNLESSSRSKINSKDSPFAASISTIRENHSQPDDLSRVESFYLKFHRLQRILEEDSSSDNYSFTSSNSDEGSCSTESTVDSTSTEDFADYIFGGQNSSPLYSRYS